MGITLGMLSSLSAEESEGEPETPLGDFLAKEFDFETETEDEPLDSVESVREIRERR